MPDWHALFGLSLPPAELVVRGTAVYWFLFLLFRFVLRRDAGSLALTDLLLLVIIADAAQNAMAGSYTSISDGVLLVATIAAWNYLLDWAAFRFKPMRRFVEGEPAPLVMDGKPNRRQLRREMMSMDELRSALREHGVEDMAEVKRAIMETDGQISVIRRSSGGADGDDARRRRAGAG